METVFFNGKVIPLDCNCHCDGCNEKATHMVENRDDRNNREIGLYCKRHADVVMDIGSPEYTVCCPNCGCGFGVN